MPTSEPKSKPTGVTLLTGGTGFLGRHLLEQLVTGGATQLRVLTTRQPAWTAAFPSVEFVTGSITDAAAVKSALRGVKQIYHLAGMVSREEADQARMYELHVDGTRLIAAAATAAKVKTLLVASTSGTIAVTKEAEVLPDENFPPPLPIISRWPYYASKFYQERAALDTFRGGRLVFVNPSLLLGPGDERLSSTKIILDFLARKIPTTPNGGLNFVDARDAAAATIAAMERGRSGEKYLLGTANWTFAEFFGRLSRLSGVAAPRLHLPSALSVSASKGLGMLWRHWDAAPPVDASGVEMAEHFWYLDATKAQRELGFAPRDPQETLHDSLKYVRETFLAQPSAFGRD